jgi:uncharacterized protein
MNVELLLTNLLSPMVLAFVLGIFATLVKSDLKLPEGLYVTLTVYLLFAIGLKGGVALANVSMSDLIWPLMGTIVLSLLTPLFAYAVARYIGKQDVANSAALAAHYGSVSAVTFIAAITFANTFNIETEGYLPALVAVLEVPAIVVALFLAGSSRVGASNLRAVTDLLRSKTVVLLVGGTLIGLVAGAEGYKQVSPLFGDLFRGALTIFLLELGMVAARQFSALRKAGMFVLLYGTAMPLINGAIGTVLAHYAGMSMGGSAVLGAMSASASYIAAPAVVRSAIPQANPSIYLTAALAVTFPFNLAIGIPLYLEIARRLT